MAWAGAAPHLLIRGLSLSPADREVQRILLELLNQMDGFDQNVNVKVQLGTNGKGREGRGAEGCGKGNGEWQLGAEGAGWGL